MALFRNVGAVTTIAPGANHRRVSGFLPITDGGAAVATRDLLLEQSGVEPVVSDAGVVQLAPDGDGGNRLRCTERIHERGGVAAMKDKPGIGNVL